MDDVLVNSEYKLDGEPQGLRTVPPGFTRGLRLEGDESQNDILATLDEIPITRTNQGIEEVSYICTFVPPFRLIASNPLKQRDEVTLNKDNGFGVPSPGKASDLDDLLPTTVRHLKHEASTFTESAQRTHLNPMTSIGRRPRRTKIQKRDWAHVIDVKKPMTNFHELVPEMAHKANF